MGEGAKDGAVSQCRVGDGGDLGRACESTGGAAGREAAGGGNGRCCSQEPGAGGKDGSGRKHGCGFHVYL